MYHLGLDSTSLYFDGLPLSFALVMVFVAKRSFPEERWELHLSGSKDSCLDCSRNGLFSKMTVAGSPSRSTTSLAPGTDLFPVRGMISLYWRASPAPIELWCCADQHCDHRHHNWVRLLVACPLGGFQVRSSLKALAWPSTCMLFLAVRSFHLGQKGSSHVKVCSV